MKNIRHDPLKKTAVIAVPGSKSYTHRALVAAALSDGVCRITSALRSEDTRKTIDALRAIGVEVLDTDSLIVVTGKSGRFSPCSFPINVGDSGTTMRLFAGLVALGEGRYTLSGSQRMHERPIKPLLDALQAIGIDAVSTHANGFPPITILAGNRIGGTTRTDCSVSSQFLSSLLFIGPYLDNGITIEVDSEITSRPYVDMTLEIMTQFGIVVTRQNYSRFSVSGGQRYLHRDFSIEPDASQAGYFWAAAAITGNSITISGMTPNSRQGDAKLVDIFEQMGCIVTRTSDGITVTGGRLTAVEVDMADMPDMVPTLAVVAAFAKGSTRMLNVARLRVKESDRLEAVMNGLTRMGISTETNGDELLIHGGTPHGAQIATCNDHRIAMSFAISGLALPGVVIENPGCVAKSFPNFWEVLEELYA